jgi:hypothetical protein
VGAFRLGPLLLLLLLHLLLVQLHVLMVLLKEMHACKLLRQRPLRVLHLLLLLLLLLAWGVLLLHVRLLRRPC